MRLLFVDDEDMTRVLFSKWCEKLGIDADVVESGSIALEKLKELGYDIIFTDLYMPGMSGYKLYQSIVDTYGSDVVILSNYDCGCKVCPLFKYKFRKPSDFDTFKRIIDDVNKRINKE